MILDFSVTLNLNISWNKKITVDMFFLHKRVYHYDYWQEATRHQVSLFVELKCSGATFKGLNQRTLMSFNKCMSASSSRCCSSEFNYLQVAGGLSQTHTRGLAPQESVITLSWCTGGMGGLTENPAKTQLILCLEGGEAAFGEVRRKICTGNSKTMHYWEE